MRLCSAKNMKIALVFYNMTIWAGGQKQVLSLAQNLRKKGHEIVLFATDIDTSVFPELWQGLSVKLIPCEYPLKKIRDQGKVRKTFVQKIADFFSVWSSFNVLARETARIMDSDFDVVNCHEDFAYKVGFFYKKKNRHARIVWTLNNVPYFFAPEKTFRKNFTRFVFVELQDKILEKPFFRSVDIVCVLSKYEESWARRRGMRVRIIRSGLDFDFFYSPVKNFLGKKQEIKLMSHSALGPHRRYEDTILAVKTLRDKGFSVSASIVCRETGNEQERVYKQFLLDLVARNDLKDYVHFYFDGLSENNLRALYAVSDIFLHPIFIPAPQYYGWGLVVFEAMAAGIPVVLCKVTGAAEVLADGKTALLADPQSPVSFAQKIQTLIENPNLYHEIAVRAQAYVKEHISWKKYAAEMETVFTK